MSGLTGDKIQRSVPLIPFLSLIREIAADAAAQPDPDTCLRHLRAGLIRLGFTRAGIWVSDPDDPTLSHGTWGTDWDGAEIDEHGLTLSHLVLVGSEVVNPDKRIVLRRVARPPSKSQRPDLPLLMIDGPPNHATIPLRADGVVVGIISVDMLPTDRIIDPEHLAALELLADVVAVAVARGRVVDSLRIANEGLLAAVAASREAEARYRTVSELGSDYTFALRLGSDGMLEVEWITDSVERLTGYTAAKILHDGKEPEFLHPDDLAQIRRNATTVLEGATTTIEYRIVTKAGKLRWNRLHCRPGWDEDHLRITRVYAAAQDITEAKRSEEALQKREQSFRLLFESNPHPMWVYELQKLSVHRGQ